MSKIHSVPGLFGGEDFYDEEFFEVNFNADPQHRYRQLTPEEIKHIIG